MTRQKINIATARIEGLTKPPYYFDHHCYYAWSITFSDTSTTFFHNLPFIKAGDTEEEAIALCNQLKTNFNEAYIHEGDKVAVIFENDGSIIAIGSLRTDFWIDVRDKFVNKSFEELNLVITSLRLFL